MTPPVPTYLVCLFRYAFLLPLLISCPRSLQYLRYVDTLYNMNCKKVKRNIILLLVFTLVISRLTSVYYSLRVFCVFYLPE